MSSQRATRTIVLVGVLLSGATSLRAQDSARPDAARWKRRAAAWDVLIGRVDSALKRVDEDQRRRVAAMPVETLSVGRLRAAVRGLPTRRAMEVLRGADSAWSHSWAAGIAPFPGAMLELSPAADDAGAVPHIAAMLTWTLTGTRVVQRAQTSPDLTRRNRRAELIGVRGLADMMLVPWKSMRVGARFPGVAFDTLRVARLAYEELATLPLLSGRACLAGNMRSCELAMGLRDFIPPYDDVLDAMGRATILEDRNTLRWPIAYDVRRACVETRDDGLCRRAFAEVTPEQLAEFTASEARGLLATRVIPAAVRAGRLASVVPPSGASAAHDLRAMADDSLTQALTGWRALVVSQRPRRVLPPASTSWAALVFAALLAAAGMRSSRWRAS